MESSFRAVKHIPKQQLALNKLELCMSRLEQALRHRHNPYAFNFHVNEAQVYLSGARAFCGHGRDKAFGARAKLAEARASYVWRQFQKSIEQHLEADLQLTDPVQRLDNAFYLLEARRSIRNPYPDGLPLVLTGKIIKEDPRLQRRIGAVLILLTGRFGCWLYDRVAT
jgi:hypothetical protein